MVGLYTLYMYLNVGDIELIVSEYIMWPNCVFYIYRICVFIELVMKLFADIDLYYYFSMYCLFTGAR